LIGGENEISDATKVLLSLVVAPSHPLLSSRDEAEKKDGKL
jgi:hypothetical protein